MDSGAVILGKQVVAVVFMVLNWGLAGGLGYMIRKFHERKGGSINGDS